LEPVHGLHPKPSQLVAAVGEDPQRLELTIGCQHAQSRRADRDDSDRVRIERVGLAVVAGVEQPDPGRKLGRHIDDPFTRLHQSLRERRPAPLAPSIAQTRRGHVFT
jgi:hypothetical protein